MNRKKIITLTATIIVTGFLASCSESESDKGVKIVNNCVENTCHIELLEVDVHRTTNIIGKTVEHTSNERALTSPDVAITWDISGGAYTTDQQLAINGLAGCEDGVCSNTSNPTGYSFPASGEYPVNVSGTVTFTDGTSREINQTSTANVTITIKDIPVKLTLKDSYGDGWDGDQVMTLTNKDSGESFGPYTCENGNECVKDIVIKGPAQYGVTVTDGDYSEEISWSISSDAGVLLSAEAPNAAPYTGVFNV